MKLTAEQLAQVDRDGFLVKERTGVRTNFAAHLCSEPFARLGRHPKMVEPAMQLRGDELSMDRFKINGRMAFDGDVQQQDCGIRLNDGPMPTPNAMDVAILFDRTPIACLPDDCLLKDDAADLPWKNGTPTAGLAGLPQFMTA